MKETSKETPWHVVYNALALRLHKFYLKNGETAGPRLFELLNNSPGFKKHNYWLVNMKRIKTASLEPIQLFVSFNRSRQSEADRQEVINIIWKSLSPRSRSWTNISFRGCPTPVALKLQYIRPERVQQRIWQVFSDVMDKGKPSLDRGLWDEVKNWRGIQIPSFTIFLFWIRSDQFLPLDKNTRQYLQQINLLPIDKPYDFDNYQRLLNDSRIGDYIELSKQAFDSRNNLQTDVDKLTHFALVNSTGYDDNTLFRLVGIRTLDENKELHKVLKSNKYYPLDEVIKPSGTDSTLRTFTYAANSAELLYHLPDLKINLTAIVGKNGSGKSTLLDLLLMAIYNMSIELGYFEEADAEPIAQLNVEVYWITDHFYKLVLDDRITMYRFDKIRDKVQRTVYQLNDTPVPFASTNLRFFYSILVNYSHYSLNALDYAIDWVSPLCHKNDGYTIPLVINPKRIEGNIDINNEKGLLNMRLLLNLLELHDPNIVSQSFRYIDNGKYFKYFSATFNQRKITEKRKKASNEPYNHPHIINLIMKEIEKIFRIRQLKPEISFRADLEFYIVDKLFTIVNRYSSYHKYQKTLSSVTKSAVSQKTDKNLAAHFEFRNVIRSLVIELKNDPSHISLKFKQAVHYLKFPSLRAILNVSPHKKEIVELDRYNIAIVKLINESKDVEMTEAQLLPPPIFNLEFYLNDDDKSSFSKASSGEFQLVSVLSSVLYHLRNIDSVQGETRYSYATVLLDEIELYFHPNMQRFFVKKLLESLSKLDTELNGIHILFSTHSPFILSDLQQQKILKLKKGDIALHENGFNTFAANIHDLLGDEFFLNDGHMGAFAQKQIEIAVNLLNYLTANKGLIDLPATSDAYSSKERKHMQIKLKNERALYENRLHVLGYWGEDGAIRNWNAETEKVKLYDLINIVGEPLIKSKLTAMYEVAFSEDVKNQRLNNAKADIRRLMIDNNLKPEDI